MEVILKKDIDNLGNYGDTLKVAPGYARNYLIPTGMAVAATPGNLRQFNAEKEAYLKKEAEKRAVAEKSAAGLEGVVLTFERKTSEEEKLFGSVTSADIEKALHEKGFNSIEKKNIHIAEPIKHLGEHDVEIKIYSGVIAKISVVVTKQEAE
ncbi:MAG: 50S ribosomal protein L9 [Thermodesulfobacteriota bacterium]